jgi:hypothetical protein
MEIPDPSQCPVEQGVRNPDGRCIQGGDLMAAGTSGYMIPSTGYRSPSCVAFPVYMRRNVPYVPNAVAVGTDLNRLNNIYYYTRLNEDMYFDPH